MVTVVILGLVASIFFTFFNTALIGYFRLQSQASGMGSVAQQSQRVVGVLRGTTKITTASNNDLQLYAYFYPSDTYVSQVHYYLGAGNTIVYADVTPMTSNPPVGTPITAQKKTYKVANSFYLPAGGTLFAYLDASGTSLAAPVTDTNAIKMIQVNMASKTDKNIVQRMTVQVNLRNRKTNL